MPMPKTRALSSCPSLAALFCPSRLVRTTRAPFVAAALIAAVPLVATGAESDSTSADTSEAPVSAQSSTSETPKSSPQTRRKKDERRVSVKLEGLSGELEDNAEVYIKSATAAGLSALSTFDRIRVERAVRDALSALGYFSPELETSWEETESAVTLRVKVDKGDPVTIAATNIRVEGDGAEEPFFKPILEKAPPIGSVLNQSDYDSIKNQLLKSAIEHGYFRSEFKEHELGVQRATHKSYWKLLLNTGPRFKLGHVTFTGSQIQEEYLRALIPFEEGEPYTNERFSRLSQNLNETGWFSTVVVVPQTEQADEHYVMPVSATVVPRIKNTVDLGLGFSSDGGPHGSMHWNRPWINSRGWSLDADVDLDKNEPSAELEFKIPLARNPLEHYWTVSASYEKTDLNDTESSQVDMAVARHWKYENRWQREVHVHFLHNAFTQADVSHTTTIVYPGIQFDRTRYRGSETFPSWGDSQRYGFDMARSGILSDVSFLRFTLNASLVRTPWEGHRFITRAAFGWLATESFDEIPPDLRFFAGGDRSIRGYDYKSVSPTDSAGRLTGAKKMLTASLEYQKRIEGPWWGAAFVDGGEAVHSFANVRWKVGVGAGVRWVSPIGPIKLDIAFPTDGGFSIKNAHLYFALGTEL